jgi:hypothetical protein
MSATCNAHGPNGNALVSRTFPPKREKKVHLNSKKSEWSCRRKTRAKPSDTEPTDYNGGDSRVSLQEVRIPEEPRVIDDISGKVGH